MFLVRSNAGHVPFATSHISLVLSHSRFGFSRCLSYVGVTRITLAVTIEFVDNLSGRKFRLILTADDILETGTGREDH